jgi:hypothetical protein
VPLAVSVQTMPRQEEIWGPQATLSPPVRYRQPRRSNWGNQHVHVRHRPEFVAVNTEMSLEHEGAAAFENARARDEIKTSTGTDIGIRGGYDQAYIDIYEQYKSGAISEAEAKARMTDIQAIEPEGFDGSRVITRQEAFAAEYGKIWDKEHPGQSPTAEQAQQ